MDAVKLNMFCVGLHFTVCLLLVEAGQCTAFLSKRNFLHGGSIDYYTFHLDLDIQIKAKTGKDGSIDNKSAFVSSDPSATLMRKNLF